MGRKRRRRMSVCMYVCMYGWRGSCLCLKHEVMKERITDRQEDSHIHTYTHTYIYNMTDKRYLLLW